ncbi:PREDICTED: uncharacterized protein LOC108558451 isoform X2 [Nicrophorus vespilloides]|nr:PREDICTED: uncharacterized protein LOC108558451 isoform X2 [Nicrophorus vespilloides]
MSDKYIFEDDSSVVQMDNHDEDFNPAGSSTLSETFMSAQSDNETQYFSVFENNETILGDMTQDNLEVPHVDEIAEEFELNQEAGEDTSSQEVVLFRVDGSDALYGFQLAQDEEGNLQKYQFQVQENSEGQFEPVPGTIEVLPYSSEDVDYVEEGQEDLDNTITPEQIYIKQEFLSSEESQEALNNLENHVDEQLEHSGVFYEKEVPLIKNIKVEDPKSAELLDSYHMYLESDHTAEEIQTNQIQTEEPSVDLDYEDIYLTDSQYVAESHNPEILVNNEDSVEVQEEQNAMVKQIFLETGNDDSYGSASTYYESIDEYHDDPDQDIHNNVEEVDEEEEEYISYVVKSPEKENIEVPRTYRTIHMNPRSVLKSTALALAEQRPQPEYDKRFAKGKVAMQARQMHNYISQTKILEAPVRLERLPRKQKIKPLERVGEEIVLEEVVVSSNGFIQISRDGVVRERKLIVPTACIQLSDSEEDGKAKKRKKRSKKSKQVEIVISDSEDEVVKPKLKRDEENGKKLENQCSKCPKSFPSVGSLRTHLQYHNFEESEKLKQKERTASSTNKYMCEICGDCFKNMVLLTRHVSMHNKKVGKKECTVCKKLFANAQQLTVHGRSHVKEQMFKATTTFNKTPKKQLLKRSIAKSSLQCQDCGRTFSTSTLLESHVKLHKRFACRSCSLTFLSKYLLDAHMRTKCVKSPMLKSKKVKLKSPHIWKLNCDKCDAVFFTYRDCFTHKVNEHGLVGSVGKAVRKSTYSRPSEHSGIPASKRLREAFAGLKNTIQNN